MRRGMLARTLEIKRACGHTEVKRLCGYESCTMMWGSMEQQIQKKVKYFESTPCIKCEGGETD